MEKKKGEEKGRGGGGGKFESSTVGRFTEVRHWCAEKKKQRYRRKDPLEVFRYNVLRDENVRRD